MQTAFRISSNLRGFLDERDIRFNSEWPFDVQFVLVQLQQKHN